MTLFSGSAEGRNSTAGGSSLRAALVGIGILMCALCLVELAIPSTASGPLKSVLDGALIAVYTVTGLLAWYRRPHNATGQLMLLTAFALWVSGTQDDDIVVLSIVGTLASSLPLALLLHLVLAFPSGRLSSRAARATVTIGYVVSVVPQIAVVVQPATRNATFALQAVVGIGVLASGVVLRGRGILRMPTVQRRQLLPFIVYGFAALAVIAVTVVVLHVDPEPGVQLTAAVVQLVVLGGLPVAFLVGLTFGAFGHAGEVGEVAAGISAASVEPALLDALAVRALGDPSARILWTSPSDSAGRFIDSAGRNVSVPPERGWWADRPTRGRRGQAHLRS